MPTEVIYDDQPDGSFLYKAHDSNVYVRAYYSHRKPEGVDPSYRIIPHPGDISGDVALRASFASPKLKGTLYGPEEYIFPKRWRKFRSMNFDEYSIYQKKCLESKGFDVDGCTGIPPPGGIVPGKSKDGMVWGFAIHASQFAVDKYNKRVARRAARNPSYKRSPLRFLEVAKYNMQTVSGTMLYITFWAEKIQDGREVLYHAKVWLKVGYKMEVQYFRQAPPEVQMNPALARESKDEPDFSEKMENGRSKYPKYCKEDIDPKSSETKKKRPIRPTMPMRAFNIFVSNLRRSRSNADKKKTEAVI